MPQLVKGGKYVFGWSIISEDGEIPIPEEAFYEYQFEAGEKVIIMPGSNTSGGFSIAKKFFLAESKLSDILARSPNLAEFRIAEGTIVDIKGKKLCWTTIHENGFLQLPPNTLEVYGVKPNDYLLAARDSYVGLGMVAKGAIFEEAKKHLDISVSKL